MINPFSSIHKKLPTTALYHIHNHSSSHMWIAYQSTLTEIRMIKYDKGINMMESFVIFISAEPIKQIKIIFDMKEQKPYLAVAFISKYVLYRENAEITMAKLKLDRNIVGFKQGFASCDGVDDGNQIYFVFATSQASIHIVKTDKPQNKNIVQLNIENRVSSICLNSGNIVLGCEDGSIVLADLNKKQIIRVLHSNSKLPIIHLLPCLGFILSTTCEGEILSIKSDLTTFSAVSVHTSMVTFIHSNQSSVYTFGDDCLFNCFNIDKDSAELKFVRNYSFKKKANLIFTVNGKTFLNFYQDSALISIE